MNAVASRVGVGVCGLALACTPRPAGGGAERGLVDASPSPSVAAVDADVSPSADARGAGALPPLVDAAWIEELPTEGGGAAHVTVPLGARGPRPVVVALHGAGDHPEWACSEWRAVFDGAVFVVCPHGVPVGGGARSWASVESVERAVDAALASAQARFGRHVAEAPFTLAGFSQGARMALRAAARRPARFPRVLALEGGYEEAGLPEVVRGLGRGARAVVLGCATGACASRFAAGTRALERAGLRVAVVDAGRRGHVFDGPVADAMRPAVVSAHADDPRFFGAD